MTIVFVVMWDQKIFYRDLWICSVILGTNSLFCINSLFCTIGYLPVLDTVLDNGPYQPVNFCKKYHLLGYLVLVYVLKTMNLHFSEIPRIFEERF